jgi:hypothetical protein
MKLLDAILPILIRAPAEESLVAIDLVKQMMECTQDEIAALKGANV